MTDTEARVEAERQYPPGFHSHNNRTAFVAGAVWQKGQQSMSREDKDTAKAYAERVAATVRPHADPYVPGVLPSDIEEWVEEAFKAGATWRWEQGEGEGYFTRWLAQHDRGVKADAWDEGFKQGGPMHDSFYGEPDRHERNPYREVRHD